MRPPSPTRTCCAEFLCIHYPHKVSAAARDALHAPRIVEGLARVIGPNVKAMQSMLFIKSEGKPGQAWHQDEYFIPTRDRSLTAVWIALDDATVENGCLWVLPGSHRRGVIYPAREQDDPRFDCTTEAFDFPYTDDRRGARGDPGRHGTDLQRLPAAPVAGELGRARLPARAGQPLHERGVAAAMASPGQGEHMAIADFRDIVMVAGEDPYAYKGTRTSTGRSPVPTRTAAATADPSRGMR